MPGRNSQGAARKPQRSAAVGEHRTGEHGGEALAIDDFEAVRYAVTVACNRRG